MKFNLRFVMSAVVCFFPIVINAQKDTNSIQLKEIIILTGKADQQLKEFAASSEIISKKDLIEKNIRSLDDALSSISGINIFRPMGFLGGSNVSLRGLGGNEQGRILVLQDGAPINKSDLGGVNWNRINPLSVSKIEIIKGPASSLYGSNAMGGIINIISNHYNKKPISGYAQLSYGSFNSLAVEAGISGTPKKEGKWHYDMNAFYRNSDGYISVTDSLRDTTHIASWVEESGMNLNQKYTINQSNHIDFSYHYYNDRRGQGVKIFDETGNAVDHDTHFFRTKYTGSKNKLKWNANIYYQSEHYFRIVESLKKSYSLYNVNSIRDDLGFLAHVNHKTTRNTFSAGVDLKKGKVNGADEYQTSSDIIRNIGDVNSFSSYFLNNYNIDNQFYFDLALHYDYIKLIKSQFTIEQASENSDILLPFQNDISGTNWNTFSPKLSLQYLKERFKTYISFSTGFRAPTLDDLTRTGFIAGGFKIANPNLQAEKISNYEIGTAIWYDKFNLSLTAYYTQGNNFMYYTSTGDYIFGTKPILEKQNITDVELYGIEAVLNLKISKFIESDLNYSYSKNEIKKFDEKPELVENRLTYSPDHKINLDIVFRNKIVNFSTSIKFTTEQYMDDENNLVIPKQFLLGAKAFKVLKNGIEMSANVQNLLNSQYLVYYDQLSIGRFINISLAYRF